MNEIRAFVRTLEGVVDGPASKRRRRRSGRD